MLDRGEGAAMVSSDKVPDPPALRDKNKQHIIICKTKSTTRDNIITNQKQPKQLQSKPKHKNNKTTSNNRNHKHKNKTKRQNKHTTQNRNKHKHKTNTLTQNNKTTTNTNQNLENQKPTRNHK
jgi:hypothetical protein